MHNHTRKKRYKVSKRDSFNSSVILYCPVIKFKYYLSNSILWDSQKYWYVSLIDAKAYLPCLYPVKAAFTFMETPSARRLPPLPALGLHLASPSQRVFESWLPPSSLPTSRRTPPTEPILPLIKPDNTQPPLSWLPSSTCGSGGILYPFRSSCGQHTLPYLV